MPEVLVVEDQEMAAISVVRTLTKEKLSVTHVTNGAKAIEILQRHAFDLIISDLLMPGIDGPQLVKWVKENPGTAHIPIIILSSRTDEYSRTQVYEAGADAYFEKPLIGFELMLKVRQLLK